MEDKERVQDLSETLIDRSTLPVRVKNSRKEECDVAIGTAEDRRGGEE